MTNDTINENPQTISDAFCSLFLTIIWYKYSDELLFLKYLADYYLRNYRSTFNMFLAPTDSVEFCKLFYFYKTENGSWYDGLSPCFFKYVKRAIAD